MRSIRISIAGLLATGWLLTQDPLIQHAVELQKKGDLAGAAADYRAYLAAHPETSPNEAAVHSNLGVVLSQMGQFEEAEKEYREGLRLNPGNPGIELNLALAYYKTGRIPDAAKQLSGLLPDAAGNLQVFLLLADCYLRMGDNKKVIELLEPLRASKAGDLGVTYLYGMALIRDNRIQEGQLVLDRILKDGNSAESHFLLGSQMFAAGDYPGAVKEFRAATERNPDLPSLESYYGQALLNTGDPDGAEAAFRKELARDPIDFEANLRLAEILFERGKPEEAAQLLERASIVRPGSPEVARARGGHAERPSALVGKMAPEFTLSGVSSESFRGKSPVLLVFGSYSCPNFRAAAPSLNALYRRYGKKVPFLMIYIREAHATGDWQSTRNEREGISIEPARTWEEKSNHASLCVRNLKIPFPAVVDGMDGKVEAAYQAWPSHAYLVGANGVIRYSTGLTELEYHTEQLESALKEVAR
jgi:tetratricopeptide (TPR) repeat protein